MARGRLSRSSRMAPSTARSASKLWGGILEVSSSARVAIPYSRLTETFSWAVTSEWSRTGTLNSPRVLMGSSIRIRRRSTSIPCWDRKVDIGLAHRPEELALIGGLPALGEGQPLDGLGLALGLVAELGRLALLTELDRVEVLQIGRGRVQGQLVRQEVVPRISVGDVADLAAAAELRHIVEEDDLHRRLRVLTRPCRGRGRRCARDGWR